MLSGVLLLLGFSSCLDETDNPGMSVEYGTRHTNYAIKGKVVNEDKEVVSDIQLIIKATSGTTYSEYLHRADTLYSDTKGEFGYTDIYSSPEVKYRIVYRDIDRGENESVYKTDSVKVDMPEPSSDSNIWEDGKIIVPVEIVLEDKSSENNP